jgi:glycerophosphoryl diester phosphodiesterase
MKNTTRRRSSLGRLLKFSLLGLVGAAVLGYLGLTMVLNNKVKALTPAQKKVKVIGHAGSGFFSPINPFNPYPANSKTSILKAMQAGADGVEVDVQLSKDGVPVLYHDPTLQTMSLGKGYVGNLPAAQVLGLAYTGGFFYDLFQDEHIISLEELLQQFRSYRELPELHLDLRNHTQLAPAYYAAALMTMLQKYRYPIRKISFVSPDEKLLLAFKKAAPGAALLLDQDVSFDHTLRVVLKQGLDGFVANAKGISAAEIKKARQHRLQVVLFGVKSPFSVYQVLLLEPDAVEVNNVPAMSGMVK